MPIDKSLREPQGHEGSASFSSSKIHEAILTIKLPVKFTSHEKYKTPCRYKTRSIITDKTRERKLVTGPRRTVASVGQNREGIV